MMNKSREEKEFKKVPYLIGAFVIILVGTIFTILEIRFNGIENSLVNTSSAEAPTVSRGTIVGGEHPTSQIGTEKATNQATEQSIDKQTDKATEKVTEKPTEIVKEKTTEQQEIPTAIIEKEFHTVYFPIYPENSYVYQDVVQEVATAEPTNNDNVNIETNNNYTSKFTENDISLLQSTLYVSADNTTELEVIFPQGLSSNGIDWSLDNSSVIKFVSADFNTVVITGCKKGTATVTAKPKGYNVTLQCTVIVTE